MSISLKYKTQFKIFDFFFLILWIIFHRLVKTNGCAIVMFYAVSNHSIVYVTRVNETCVLLNVLWFQSYTSKVVTFFATCDNEFCVSIGISQ